MSLTIFRWKCAVMIRPLTEMRRHRKCQSVEQEVAADIFVDRPKSDVLEMVNVKDRLDSVD